jgi:hypothetical protein
MGPAFWQLEGEELLFERIGVENGACRVKLGTREPLKYRNMQSNNQNIPRQYYTKALSNYLEIGRAHV